MPTLAKIPQSEKSTGALLCGRYAIFGKGKKRALGIAEQLAKLDSKNGIPDYGWIVYKKRRVYYCLSDLIENTTIYSKS